jgi:diguanylate cyclase (GGDEF)-like protein
MVTAVDKTSSFMKILLVEDDASTAQFLSATLTADQYTVDVATDGQVGLELAKQWEYDLIVLDVMIPKLDGIRVCQQLRSQDNQTPILLLTAKGSNQDVVTGLDAGADDYLTKPFDLSQLLARIRALLRRRGASPSSLILAWGALTLDMVSAQVMYQEQIIDLRPREYKLLELFLRHPLRVFSRNAIIDQIWTSEDFPTEGAVTNLIKDLRQRLKRAGVTEELIETVYGLGYRLKAAPDKKPVAKPAEITEAQQQGMAAIAQAQEWFQASLEQRIEHLVAVEQALQQGRLSLQQRQQGQAEAHKLVGGLGTFGYAAGVAFARQIETLLTGTAALEVQQIQEFSQQLAGLKQAIARPTNRPISDYDHSSQTGDPAAPEAPETAVIVLSPEAALSQTATELLQPWGIQVIQVTHPDRFWPVLTTITPELLLLDADAAELDSLTFCQTVRRDPAWNVPIVLLTTEANPEFIQAIFAAGVDDFIRKPIIEPEFVSRVVNRIERLRPQKFLPPLSLPASQQAELDALTQLVNRRSFLRLLQQTWMQQMPLALILCDLDQFTRYNDRYGSMAGDACLQQIASLLQQSTEGIVARYGGDEFAILLFNTPLDQAVRVVQTLQQVIRSAPSSGHTTQPAVTVSLGITGTTSAADKSVETLLTTAAQALYAAKWRGGNTYCLYS